jgi:phosphoribosylglycinamide formyltransferase-1
MNLAVFVSGGGTNLQAIIDAINSGVLPNINIELVVADRNCYAIERATTNNIKHAVFNRKEINHEAIYKLLLENNISHIVLAGYLSIIDVAICKNWKNKIINIHPSLLPKYGGKGMYGEKVHEAVVANKDSFSGATVHFVTEGIDEGEIVVQKQIALSENETVVSLQQKVLKVEHEILIDSLKILYAKEKSAD